MKKIPCSIFLCLIIFTFCSNHLVAKRINVVTTLPSLASIAESIGGDKIKVFSITRGSQDAHYVDAKPSYMLKLNKSDLLIYSGLELEIGWLPLLIQGSRNNKVSVGSMGNLNAAMALEQEPILEKPAHVDRSMGDVHPGGNPHYLLNPYNGIRVAELITERLSTIDSENSTFYNENLEQFRNLLHNKITELEQLSINMKGLEVVCYHVHWSYLLDWLGLESAGYIELRPGIPPTPKHKKEMIELMENMQIKVVIISSWKEPTKAREVAHAVGANLVVLPGELNASSNTVNYISWIEYMVISLNNAFSGTEPDSQKRIMRRHQERKRGTE